MRVFVLTLISLLLIIASPVTAQDFDKGVAAYNAGDFVMALKEFKPLAEDGDSAAQYNLGVMYTNGQGVPQDYKEAVKWYTLAAEQGTAEAQTNLGNIYFDGRGVPQDYKEAAKWYTLAAEQGIAKAQSNLGFMYDNGHGVLQDNVIAHMWYNIGAANGSENGGKNRDIIAKNMTSEDISKAQAMARQCMNSNYQNCGY